MCAIRFASPDSMVPSKAMTRRASNQLKHTQKSQTKAGTHPPHAQTSPPSGLWAFRRCGERARSSPDCGGRWERRGTCPVPGRPEGRNSDSEPGKTHTQPPKLNLDGLEANGPCPRHYPTIPATHVARLPGQAGSVQASKFVSILRLIRPLPRQLVRTIHAAKCPSTGHITEQPQGL